MAENIFTCRNPKHYEALIQYFAVILDLLGVKLVINSFIIS